MKLEGCSALITGASAGIGREFARQLAYKAGAIVLVARRAERLEELRDELTSRDPNLNVHARSVDLRDRRQIEELCAWLEHDKIAIDLLVNNAGLGDHGPFASSDPERIAEMIDVNMAALTLLTRRLLPRMLERGRGAILNVSSTAGFLPLPGMAVYAATKAYVTSFSEALRMELRGTGISVTSVCPGPVHTEFTDVASRKGAGKMLGPDFLHVPAKEIARTALAAVEHDRALVIPGILIKCGMFFLRLIPLPVLRLAGKLAK